MPTQGRLGIIQCTLKIFIQNPGLNGVPTYTREILKSFKIVTKEKII